jgi:hypothetical protein
VTGGYPPGWYDGLYGQPGPGYQPPTSEPARTYKTLLLFLKMAIGGAVFYLLADFTAVTSNEVAWWSAVFSPGMTQLWTGAFRVLFIIGMGILLIWLIRPEMFNYLSRDHRDGPDAGRDFLYHISPNQRLWHLFAWLSLFVLLAVLLLQVKLPTAESAGP